jgi:acetyl-CoA carboxylase biotin carboxyl carrier protein
MDLKEIKSLIKLLKETDLSEIEVEESGRKIRIRQEKYLPSAPVHQADSPLPTPSPVPPQSVVEESVPNLAIISSPIVGTFYRTHAPGADPYVKTGDVVKKGQTLCIVEAMKLMNEIESDLDGTVVAVCVEDKSPVEFGQPLFKIEPL